MSKKKGLSAVLMGFLGFVVGFVACFGVVNYVTLPETESVVAGEIYYSKGGTQINESIDIESADISIHFLELGNKYTGDCTYIKAGDTDILIDCGSKSNSVETVSNYLNQYVTDNILEYVIVTHAHQDHYAGFATSAKIDGIFDLYECKTIIDFAGVTNGKKDTTMYKNYQRELSAEIEAGAEHYTALDCVNENKIFTLAEGITMEILDSQYYSTPDTTNENNNSVCTLITQKVGEKEKNFLFTGDLEAEGETYLAQNDNLPHVDLYKAGHHGSKTSSNKDFLEVIQPKTICVCCCAGSSEYTTVANNQFPTQEFIDRVSVYTSEIYVTTMCVDYKNDEFTSFNGNIVYMSQGSNYNVKCSNNNIWLKDSEWFKANRTLPQNAVS